MGKAEMEGLRRRLRLVDPDRVLVVFAPDASTKAGALDAVLECSPCGTLLEWNKDNGWWECCSCSYELTVEEACELLRMAEEALQRLIKDVGGRKTRRWHWLTWLTGRERSRPSSS